METTAVATTTDPKAIDLAALSDEIEKTHHAYLRRELPRLKSLIRKAVAAHGPQHPELLELESVFGAFTAGLSDHMMKEEMILFPMCRELQSGTGQPAFHCGSIQNPIRVMIMEHDEAGAGLERMRALTGDYRPPADACAVYRELYASLEALEKDMSAHVYKENVLLFPAAAEREEKRMGNHD